MWKLIVSGAFVVFLVVGNSTIADARHGHGGVAAISSVPAGCAAKGINQVDLGGSTDDCSSATLNPSFQWTDAFTNTSSGFRQSGQSTYFYNDGTLTYNISCIDNGCGYDTTQLNFDPVNESFTATTAKITAGVLFFDNTTLGLEVKSPLARPS